MRFTLRADAAGMHPSHPKRTNQPAMAAKTKCTRPKKSISSPKTFHPDAAGIDLEATVHYVAVPAGRDPRPVRHFGTQTADLNTIADWFNENPGTGNLRLNIHPFLTNSTILPGWEQAFFGVVGRSRIFEAFWRPRLATTRAGSRRR
jgi:hypothetical protein